LVAYQTGSHTNAVGGKAGYRAFDRPPNTPAGLRKANKASIPRYRQGKAGKNTNKASMPGNCAPKSFFSRKDRGVGGIVPGTYR